ncbi:MAG: hypothetical protein RLZZ557_1276, partial [Bacteroidota bacterium]
MMKRSLSRRNFLQTTSSAALAAMASGVPMLGALSCQSGKINATADSVILLWMGGGMAHTETFDPKKFTPYTKGMQSSSVLSTFNKVPTVLDDVFFSEGLEKIGGVMDKGTLIRSYVAADLGHILHTRHQYHWHTCYRPPQTVAVPHLGSWIARELGQKNGVIPAFIDIGQRFSVGEGEE